MAKVQVLLGVVVDLKRQFCVRGHLVGMPERPQMNTVAEEALCTCMWSASSGNWWSATKCPGGLPIDVEAITARTWFRLPGERPYSVVCGHFYLLVRGVGAVYKMTLSICTPVTCLFSKMAIPIIRGNLLYGYWELCHHCNVFFIKWKKSLQKHPLFWSSRWFRISCEWACRPSNPGKSFTLAQSLQAPDWTGRSCWLDGFRMKIPLTPSSSKNRNLTERVQILATRIHKYMPGWPKRKQTGKINS